MKTAFTMMTLAFSLSAFAGGGGTGSPRAISLASVSCFAELAQPGHPPRNSFSMSRYRSIATGKSSSVGALLNLATPPSQNAFEGTLRQGTFRSLDSRVEAFFNIQTSTVLVRVNSGEGQGSTVELPCVAQINKGNLPDGPMSDPMIQTDLATALDVIEN